MSPNKFKYSFLLVLFLLILSGPVNHRNIPVNSYPALPVPIARERVLVTSAGQGAEGLIVAKMCDQINLEYDFRYQGTPADSADKNSLILVVGVSPAGMGSIYTTPGEEERRVLMIVQDAYRKHKPIIVMHLGGRERRGGLNDRLIKAVVPLSSYVLVAGNGNHDDLFTRLTREQNIPLTEVAGINELKIPLNSAFR